MFNQTNLKFREMKKSIFMFALATLMSASVFAQDNDAKRLPGYKTTFEAMDFGITGSCQQTLVHNLCSQKIQKTLNSEPQSLSCRHFL